MAEVLRKGELAQRVGVSAARVSQWVAAGLPVLPDGRVDLQQALDWITKNVDRSGGGWPVRKAANRGATAAMPPASPTPNLGALASSSGAPLDANRALVVARARKLLAEAKKAERAERRQAGELIEASTLREYANQFSALVKDHALSQADRLANILAATTDGAEVHRLIREDNNRMLTKLAKAIEDLPHVAA
ncbi:MAG TPA: hypothetical protein VKX45_03395 [Bryobacteraceae bacterium]|nr:hypothetical protein [Bryobacteraceae bacterium]